MLAVFAPHCRRLAFGVVGFCFLRQSGPQGKNTPALSKGRVVGNRCCYHWSHERQQMRPFLQKWCLLVTEGRLAQMIGERPARCGVAGFECLLLGELLFLHPNSPSEDRLTVPEYQEAAAQPIPVVRATMAFSAAAKLRLATLLSYVIRGVCSRQGSRHVPWGRNLSVDKAVAWGKLHMPRSMCLFKRLPALIESPGYELHSRCAGKAARWPHRRSRAKARTRAHAHARTCQRANAPTRPPASPHTARRPRARSPAHVPAHLCAQVPTCWHVSWHARARASLPAHVGIFAKSERGKQGTASSAHSWRSGQRS